MMFRMASDFVLRISQKKLSFKICNFFDFVEMLIIWVLESLKAPYLGFVG